MSALGRRVGSVVAVVVLTSVVAGCSAGGDGKVAFAGDHKVGSVAWKADWELSRLLEGVGLPPDVKNDQQAVTSYVVLDLVSPPAALPAPTTGVPQGAHVVHKANYWSVRKPLADTLAYLQDNPPRGVTPVPADVPAGGTAARQSYVYVDTKIPEPPLGETQLRISVAADGPDRSVVRADAYVVVQDSDGSTR